MLSTPTPVKKPGYLFIFWCMLLVAYADIYKYVLAVRSPNEADDKRFGLLADCIIEVAKIVGSLIKLTVSLTVSAILLTVWPVLLPFVTAVTAGLVYHRVNRMEKESETNTEKLHQDLTGG